MEVLSQAFPTPPHLHISSSEKSSNMYSAYPQQQVASAAAAADAHATLPHGVKLPPIRELLTPPHSGHTSQFNDSFRLSTPTDDKHDPAIFGGGSSSSGSESGSVIESPLFSATTRHHTPPASETSSEPESIAQDVDDKSAIKDHQSQFNWRKLHVLEPSPEDYQLCATFYRDFSRLGWVEHGDHVPYNEPPPSFSSPYAWYRPSPAVIVPSRRKILHDASPSRRSVTSASGSEKSTKRSQHQQHLGGGRSTSKSSNKSRQDRSARVKSNGSREHGEKGGSGAESKSARAKSTKPATDSNYRNYPDYSPPFSTMERPMEHARATKRFAGQFIDSTHDPERDQLHEAEVIAAEHLSLPCAKYLCTKRQIFQAYVQHLQAVANMRKAGSAKIPSWNKTEAQRKCNVDVNKASQLWQFFNDIGWFKEAHFQHHLNSTIAPPPPPPASSGQSAQ